MPDEKKNPENEKRMSFTQHLGEFRWRLIISTIGVAVGFAVSYAFADSIVIFLQRPFPKDLIFLAPTEAFFVNLKIALFSAIFLAMPVILLELWKFVAPGLYEHEKRYSLPFVVFSTLLFLTGGVFAYALVLPVAIKFLMHFASELIQPMISIGNYFTFAIKLILAFGVVFQFPLILIFFNKIGILNAVTLTRNRKYAILGTFALAAILTPPDIFSQLLMAAPILVLYELSILAIKIFDKKSRKEEGGK